MKNFSINYNIENCFANYDKNLKISNLSYLSSILLTIYICCTTFSPSFDILFLSQSIDVRSKNIILSKSVFFTTLKL